MTTAPHPLQAPKEQRCETCIGPCPILTGSFFEDRLWKEPELARYTALVGCTSHSFHHTPASAQCPYSAEDDMCLECKAHEERIVTEAARQAREDLLKKKSVDIKILKEFLHTHLTGRDWMWIEVDNMLESLHGDHQ